MHRQLHYALESLCVKLHYRWGRKVKTPIDFWPGGVVALGAMVRSYAFGKYIYIYYVSQVCMRECVHFGGGCFYQVF